MLDDLPFVSIAIVVRSNDANAVGADLSGMVAELDADIRFDSADLNDAGKPFIDAAHDRLTIALRCSMVVAGRWPCEPRIKNPCTPVSRYHWVSSAIIGRSGSPLPSNTAGIGITNPFTVFCNSARVAMSFSVLLTCQSLSLCRRLPEQTKSSSIRLEDRSGMASDRINLSHARLTAIRKVNNFPDRLCAGKVR